MSWWKKAKKAVKKAAKAAKKAVNNVVNTVTEAVSDAVETVGNAAADGLNKLADAASSIPIVGGAVSGALRWAGEVVAGATTFVASTIKAAGGLITGVIGGAIDIVAGIITLDAGQILDGLLGIVSGIAGAILVAGGALIGFVQGALGIQAQRRRLTDGEVALLKRVFHESVALYNVRLVEGRAGLFGLNDRPFTLGNVIYLKDRDVSHEPELLVHECTHVWQYQHLGTSYASDAIGAQWFVEDAYSWEREIGRGNHEWVDFNREAQGSFLEDIYVHGCLLARVAAGRDQHAWSPSPQEVCGNGVFYDADGNKKIARFEFNDTDHTDRANRGVAAVRAAESIRPSIAI